MTKQVQIKVRGGKTHHDRIVAAHEVDLDQRSPSGKMTYKN